MYNIHILYIHTYIDNKNHQVYHTQSIVQPPAGSEMHMGGFSSSRSS